MIVKYILHRINYDGTHVINHSGVSYTCGRAKENQIVCPSMLVSRSHCIFIIQSDGLYIRDLNSSNGIYINGEKRLQANTKLKLNDKIGIGVPDVDPRERHSFVFTLDIQEDVKQNDSSKMKPNKEESINYDKLEKKIKLEPGESKDFVKLEKKRRCEFNEANKPKKQKTENSCFPTPKCEKRDTEPVASTSTANVDSVAIKKEVDDDIEIISITSSIDGNSPVKSKEPSTSKKPQEEQLQKEVQMKIQKQLEITRKGADKLPKDSDKNPTKSDKLHKSENRKSVQNEKKRPEEPGKSKNDNNENINKQNNPFITNIKSLSRDNAIDLKNLRQNVASEKNNKNAQKASVVTTNCNKADIEIDLTNTKPKSSDLKLKNCDKPVLINKQNNKTTSVNVNETDDDIILVNQVENNNIHKPYDLEEDKSPQSDDQPSSSEQVAIKEELMTSYSQIDDICLVDEDDVEFIFSSSQLSSKESVNNKKPVETSGNNVSHDEDDVIVLSDSDDEDNVWFERLYNSQVYKPSEELLIKKEIEETNADEEFELQSNYNQYLKNNSKESDIETLKWNQIPETEEQDDDVWDETIQSQQTTEQEVQRDHDFELQKSVSKQKIGKLPETKSSEDEFLDVERDMNLALEMDLKDLDDSDDDNDDEAVKRKRSKNRNKAKRICSSSDDDDEVRKDFKEASERSRKSEKHLHDNKEKHRISKEMHDKRKSEYRDSSTVSERKIQKISEDKKSSPYNRDRRRSDSFIERKKDFIDVQEKKKQVDKKQSRRKEQEKGREEQEKGKAELEKRKVEPERKQEQEREKQEERGKQEERRNHEQDRGREEQEKRKMTQERRNEEDLEKSSKNASKKNKEQNDILPKSSSIPNASTKIIKDIPQASKSTESSSNVFKFKETSKKNWEAELQNLDEKSTLKSIKEKKPVRRSTMFIEPQHMPVKEKRSSIFKNNNYKESSTERNEEVESEMPREITPRKRSKSLNRRPQNNFFKEITQADELTHKERRKEKLKEISAKQASSEKNVNTAPPRKSKGIAKVTHKTRQDTLLFDQQKAQSAKPGVAHQRVNTNNPVAHCSKYLPDLPKIQVNENQEHELNNFVVPNVNFSIKLIDVGQINNKSENTSRLTDVTNKINIKKNDNDKFRRKSCLAIVSKFGRKSKKRVSFALEKNQIREYQIDSRNSLNRVVGKDAPINKKKIEPSQFEPQIDEYLSRIFEWNPNWIEEQKNLPTEPPVYNGDRLFEMRNNYVSFSHYSDILRPLLLLEMWNALTKECDCVEKREKFQQRLCSVVTNSITQIKTPIGDYQTNLLIEILLTREEFQKELYPSPGHLIKFSYLGRQEDKASIHTIFAYVKNRSHVEIRSNTRFNRELLKRIPNAEVLVTLSVLSRPSVEPSTDTICKIWGVMYLKTNMREILALQNLQNSPLKELILTPTVKDYHLPEMNQIQQNPLVTKENLNDRQFEAVMRISESALTETPQISLIHGPPGTGKSKVIVNIVSQILAKSPNTQILVCAPSNAAVDELALRLLQIRAQFNFKSIKMVRVGRTEAMNPRVRNVSLTELSRKQVEKDYTYTEKEEMTMKENEEKLKKLEQFLRLVEERIEDIRRNGVKGDINQLYRQRKSFQNDIKMLNAKCNQHVDFKKLSPAEKNKINRDNEMLMLSKATVIACTLSSCYSGMMEKIFGGKERIKIPICIVDEATQCCETENLIPLMLGVKKMILVGDTNQLPATVLSKKAKEKGLDQSLFARIQKIFENEAENPVIMLNVQYRMDYPILSWPNAYFYKGKLIDQAKIKQVPYSPYRVLNLNSHQDETKFSNTNEAEFVSKLIYVMINSVDASLISEPLTIGVITPYQSQKSVVLSKIEQRLRQVPSNIKSKFLYEVNTVDSFQGQERDVIIMSCVRSSGIGFMSDKQRLCVALTRAKSSLILCGNFKTFQKDEMWNNLLSNARSRGILINVDDNASLSDIEKHILKGY